LRLSADKNSHAHDCVKWDDQDEHFKQTITEKIR